MNHVETQAESEAQTSRGCVCIEASLSYGVKSTQDAGSFTQRLVNSRSLSMFTKLQLTLGGFPSTSKPYILQHGEGGT